MASLSEIKALALELTVSERATLASRLLQSLPPQFEDDDDEMAEALRRRQEMENDPDSIISWEQLQKTVGR